MSLIQTPWLVLGAGACVALLAPLKLLQSEEIDVVVPPLPPPVEIEMGEPETLAYALSAPPFTEGRVPQPDPPPADAAVETVEAAPPPASPPSLVGLAVQNRGRAVALARGSNGETMMLSTGEAIDGWTLVGIARDQATFEREGERHVARLDFGNRPAAATAAASAPVPIAPVSPHR